MVLLVHRLVFVYIYDYCGAMGNSEDAWRSYRGLTELLMSLGLDLSYEKCYSPRTTLAWIGVELNTLNMTMRIDPKKVAEVHALVCSWLDGKGAGFACGEIIPCDKMCQISTTLLMPFSGHSEAHEKQRTS